MKLLLITAVESYQEDVIKVLKENNIHSFTSTQVSGHANSNVSDLGDNWFGGNQPNQSSIMYYVFVSEEDLDPVFKAVEDINSSRQSRSKIHLSVMAIERNN